MMGRPGKWQGATTSIRVPVHAVDQVLALARSLDADRVPGVGVNGVKEGARSCGSSLLPEELEQMARLQFAGLTKYLEPDAFLSLAIAHVERVKGSVQNSPRLFLINVDDAAYMIQSEAAAMAAADPAIERLEAALAAAGLTRRDDKLLVIAKLVKAMEQQGTLERIKEEQ